MAVVMITGTSRGLGLELVKYITSTVPSSQVSSIIATSRGSSPSPALSSLISSSNGRISHITLDVDDRASIDNAAKATADHIGSNGLDILINNAGILAFEPGHAPGMESLEKILHTNVVGVHRVTAAFLPLLRRGSQKKIVNISSTLGSISMAESFNSTAVASYNISKAALNMLTAQYSLDLKKEGFTVFALSPGWLKTDLGGQNADLEPEIGAKGAWDVIESATSEKDSGAFRNIYVEGHQNYKGTNAPW